MELNCMSRINRSPVQEILDGTDFKWLIERYLEYCAKILAEITVSSYQYKLFYFMEWWDQFGPDRAYKLLKEDMFLFNEYLDNRSNSREPNKPLSWHTRSNALRRLATMFRWGYREGYLDKDYSHWVPEPTGKPSEREPINSDVVQKLIRAASDTAKPARNMAIVAVFAGTGIRRKEAASILIPDVKIDENGHGSIIIRSRLKNSNTRTVAIAPDAGIYIYKYIDWTFRKFGPLFPGHDINRALTPMGIYRVMKSCCEIAGLDIDRPCQDLRVLFATDWHKKHKKEGDNLLLIRQLGHRRYHTTADHYIVTDVSDIQEVITSPMSK